MPGRLKRSAGAADRIGLPHVELYEVACACGHVVSGQRLPCPQAVECPACGEALFVLPVDPYPAPDSRAAARRWRRGVGPVTRRLFGGGLLSGWGRPDPGRLLLLTLVLVLTAGLGMAFWLDARSRERSAARETRAAEAQAPNVRLEAHPRPATYRGRVQDGAITLDGGVELPEGTRLSIRVVPQAHASEPE